MAVKALYILPCGFIHIDRSIFLSGIDMGKVMRAPIFSVLAVHREGPVLIDLGLNPDGLISPHTAWGPRAELIKPSLNEEDTVSSRLKQVGLEVSDIRMVILTHMHWDHTGSLRLFQHCPIVVQRDEHRFAFSPDPFFSAPYMKNHFDHPLDYRLMDGDGVVLPGISVIRTPGHTPGHQSVLVRLDDGRSYILAGDAVPLVHNVERKIPLGNACHAKACLESIYRLDHWGAILEAEIIPSHDPAVFDRLNTAPAPI